MKSFTNSAISGTPRNVHRPGDRDYDAVRFSVARDQGSRLLLWFVCETGHRPAKHGTVEYDVEHGTWILSDSDQRIDPNIQKMLECYVQSYLQRRIQPATADSPSANL
jgi:hypothetical protein